MRCRWPGSTGTLFLSTVPALLVGFLLSPAVLSAADGSAAADQAGIPTRSLVSTGLVFYPSEAVTIPFTIASADALPLVITRVQQSCRCFRLSPLPTSVAAGSPCRLDISTIAFDHPGGMEGSVCIDGSCGGAERRITCAFAGTVMDYLAWPQAAAVIDLGDVPEDGLPQAWTFPLRRGPHPAAWDRMAVAVSGGSGVLSAGLDAPVAEPWTLTISARRLGFSGIMSAQLRWTFWSGTQELPYHPTRSLRLGIVGPVQASPPNVMVGGLRADEEADRVIQVVSRAGGDAEITQATSSDPLRISCRISPDRHAVQLHAIARLPAGSANGSIDLAIAGQGTVRVPYFLAVQDPRVERPVPRAR